MESVNGNSAFGGDQIYTLAQSRTASLHNPPVLITGKGSDLTNSKAIAGRVKRKIITQSMTLALIDIAKAKGDEHNHKHFWNTYHCQERIYSHEGRIYGHYCKNRICTLCNSIRKAELINKYLPVIEQWEDPQFLTLTIRSIQAKNLNKFLGGMIKAFCQIKDTQRKRYSRGKGIKLIGIKSLECNFNPQRRTYNPHFHLITPNIETSELLINEWLKKWTPKWTSRVAQLNKSVFDNETALIEIIKYGSKIFTEPDLKKKGKQKTPPQIYATAFYNILESMKGHRIFDRFGFDLPKKEVIEKSQILTSDYKEWLFDPNLLDWHSSTFDEVLTGYHPTNELMCILENNIDVMLE
jgi:plasmid rolling circle replication initiator protein Rep